MTISGEPLQTLDALRNGLAAAIENQVVHADRRESLNVAGNVFGLRVLDLGCGVGRHALLLAEHGFDVEAI